MIYNVYCIRDLKVGYMQPSLDINDSAATRNFKLGLATVSPESVMGFAPEDFDLYRIGTFDTEKGVISPLTVPEPIANGASLEV